MLSREKLRRAFQFHVITGLDPVISSARDKMAGSSPAMTLFVVRHARARPAHLPLARDGSSPAMTLFVVRHARA